MSSSLTISNKTAEDRLNTTLNLPWSPSELRDLAFQLKELARAREQEEQRRAMCHVMLMQEIRAKARHDAMVKSLEDGCDRLTNTIDCGIKELSNKITGISNDLKEIAGHLEKQNGSKCD